MAMPATEISWKPFAVNQNVAEPLAVAALN
jgi:hypothetical protein